MTGSVTVKGHMQWKSRGTTTSFCGPWANGLTSSSLNLFIYKVVSPALPSWSGCGDKGDSHVHFLALRKALEVHGVTVCSPIWAWKLVVAAGWFPSGCQGHWAQEGSRWVMMVLG
jgi:hypothetical protein